MRWLIFLFLSLTLHADPVACLKVMTVPEYWRHEEPQLVHINGQARALSYSFDSEVATPYLLQVATRAPEMHYLIETLFGDESLTLGEIQQKLHMTEAQVRAFALRKGASPADGHFVLTDLNGVYLASLARPTLFTEPFFVNAWNDYMADLNLPIGVKLDRTMIEFVHTSFENSPADYFRLMQKYQSLFQKPNTHLHLGIPAGIGEAHLKSIARAVETRLVLALAGIWPSADKPMGPYYEYTTLGEDSLTYSEQQRGVIRLHLGRWSHNEIADLELRQWGTERVGFENLAMASQMALQSQKIMTFDSSTMYNTYDISAQVGNLAGAMKYAALILGRSADASDRALVAQLNAYAPKLATLFYDESNGYTGGAKLKSEVSKFIVKNKIYERLTLDKFLRP